jgi:hypothetical protein
LVWGGELTLAIDMVSPFLKEGRGQGKWLDRRCDEPRRMTSRSLIEASKPALWRPVAPQQSIVVP